MVQSEQLPFCCVNGGANISSFSSECWTLAAADGRDAEQQHRTPMTCSAVRCDALRDRGGVKDHQVPFQAFGTAGGSHGVR
jgi:hypothetical protein